MAALNDRHTGSYCAGATDWSRRISAGWVVNEHVFAAGTITTSDCVVMFRQPFHGLRIADWFVLSQQLDSNGAPALLLNIGGLNSTSTPTGLSSTWLSGSTVGRASGTSMVRNTDGSCALDRASQGRDIGVHFGTVAATPSHTSQRLVMGLLLVPW